MKLLIVDDEPHVIKAIRLFLSQAQLGLEQILDAGTVTEAITLLETFRPEILITDIVMSDMNGLDLIEYLIHSEMHTQVIAVSGFDNYEYIRAVLKNGATDYLLKPIDMDRLCAAVRHAQEQYLACRMEEQRSLERSKLINQMQISYMEDLLYRMMTGAPQKEEQLLSTASELIKNAQCRVAYTSCRLFCSENQPYLKTMLAKTCATLKERLKAEAGSSLAFLSPQGENELLVLLTGDHPQALDALGSPDFPFPLHFGISELLPFPQELQYAFETAKENFWDQDATSGVSGVSNAVPSRIKPPKNNVELLSALLTGNDAFIQKAVIAWCKGQIGEEGPVSLRDVTDVMERYQTLRKTWAQDMSKRYEHLCLSPSMPITFDQTLNSQGGFSRKLFYERIALDMLSFYQALTSPESNPENNVIYQVQQYIDLNYRKPFNQIEYARHFYINKDYMCRKFTSTFHVNMVTYVNRLRIREARDMLANPTIPIRDIASQTGYRDEKYFSKRFKKECGLTPREYRDKLLRQENDADR